MKGNNTAFHAIVEFYLFYDWPMDMQIHAYGLLTRSQYIVSVGLLFYLKYCTIIVLLKLVYSQELLLK